MLTFTSAATVALYMYFPATLYSFTATLSFFASTLSESISTGTISSATATRPFTATTYPVTATTYLVTAATYPFAATVVSFVMISFVGEPSFSPPSPYTYLMITSIMGVLSYFSFMSLISTSLADGGVLDWVSSVVYIGTLFPRLVHHYILYSSCIHS